jgi:hypothetical protein
MTGLSWGENCSKLYGWVPCRRPGFTLHESQRSAAHFRLMWLPFISSGNKARLFSRPGLHIFPGVPGGSTKRTCHQKLDVDRPADKISKSAQMMAVPEASNSDYGVSTSHIQVKKSMQKNDARGHILGTKRIGGERLSRLRNAPYALFPTSGLWCVLIWYVIQEMGCDVNTSAANAKSVKCFW